MGDFVDPAKVKVPYSSKQRRKEIRDRNRERRCRIAVEQVKQQIQSGKIPLPIKICQKKDLTKIILENEEKKRKKKLQEKYGFRDRFIILSKAEKESWSKEKWNAWNGIEKDWTHIEISRNSTEPKKFARDRLKVNKEFKESFGFIIKKSIKELSKADCERYYHKATMYRNDKIKECKIEIDRKTKGKK